MILCKSIQRELSAYLDGEVSREAASRIEQHLALCARCRDEARALTATYELLELYPQALRSGAGSRQAPAAPRRLFPRPVLTPFLTVRRAGGLLAILTGLIVGAVLQFWIWPPISPPVFASPILSDQRSLPAPDRDSFGLSPGDPVAELYTALTAGSRHR